MLLSERSSFIIRLFRYIGIAPFARTKNLRKIRSFTHFIPILLSALLSFCLTIFLLIFPHFESLGPIHTIINFSYVWSLYLTIFSANCQCHLYKSVYRRATYRIRQIQKSFSEKSITKFVHQFQLYYKIKILIIFVLFFGSQGLVFVEVWLISETRGLWASLTASFVTSSLRILYPMHVLHIVLYSDTLTMFIKNLNLQATQSVSLCFTSSSKVEFLKNIKSMHMEMVTLTTEMNAFFGMNLLFLMINSFIYISYQLYWLFLSLQMHWGWLAIIGKLMDLSSALSVKIKKKILDGLVSLSYGIASLGILVNSCQSCSLEVR